MTFLHFIWAIEVLLGILTLACFKIANWHRKEAQYWRQVDFRVTFVNPRVSEVYGPVAMWSREHPPGLLQRLGRWKDPEQRMAAAAVASPRKVWR